MISTRHEIWSGDELISTETIEYTWDEIRAIRDVHLEETDWWALKDLTMSQAKKDYRQALRDLPQNYESANDAADNWPVMPDA